MPTILIRNGRVLDPASGRDEQADVLIHGGRIARIGRRLDAPGEAEVIDAGGCLVTPGLVDPHVHLREPGGEHKETIATGTRAAVAGGFTTVCCMPNTSPALDAPETLRFVTDRAAETGSCRVFPVAAGTVGRKGREVVDVAALVQAGAVGFSDDGDAIADRDVMARVLEAVRPTGLAFMQHCQDHAMTGNAPMHAGRISARLGLRGWPREAEETIVERDVALVRASGCRYHVQHISSGGTVELIRRARAEGLPVTGEASPHHLLLTHEACAGYDTHAKMNPPLREAADVEALRRGVAEGVVTVLATDHAPHAPEEKGLPFEQAPFGIVGLETALPLYAEALVHSGAIGWERLIALLTVEPARLCNLDRLGIGRLEEGGPADVAVIDPDEAWTITPGDLAGRSRNSPFLGRRVRGRIAATIAAGVVRHARSPAGA